MSIKEFKHELQLEKKAAQKEISMIQAKEHMSSEHDEHTNSIKRSKWQIAGEELMYEYTNEI